MGNKNSQKTHEAATKSTQTYPHSTVVEEKLDDVEMKTNDDDDDYIFDDDYDYESSSISDTAASAYDSKSHRLLKECMDLHKSKAKYDISDDKSITFYPSESVGVKTSTERLDTERFTRSNRFSKIMEYLKCNKLEHIYDDKMDIIKTKTYINSFAAAAEYAFYKHYPLSIKPSDIWILILQSTALHISQNAEKLRKVFVNHKDKKDLTIYRPGFVKGAKNNDWNGVVNEFVQQIDKNTVDDIVSLFEPDFTTATLEDRLAARVTTMDIMKEYFKYSIMAGCGFPQITLRGTKEDWIKLKEKTKILLQNKVVPKFGVKWGKALFPVLQRFINAYDGKIDCLFWNSMVRRGAHGGSGGNYIPSSGDTDGYYCGWINVLFPYNEHKQKPSDLELIFGDKKSQRTADGTADIIWNEYCVPYSKKASYVLKGISRCCTQGIEADNFPIGVGSAPVTYEAYNLKFVSGFLGMQQDPNTLEISCKIGWFVAEQ